MDKKDAKRFKELYFQENAYAQRNFEEIELNLQKNRDSYLNEISEERKKEKFEKAYKSIYQLNCYDKAFAEK